MEQKRRYDWEANFRFVTAAAVVAAGRLDVDGNAGILTPTSTHVTPFSRIETDLLGNLVLLQGEKMEMNAACARHKESRRQYGVARPPGKSVNTLHAEEQVLAWDEAIRGGKTMWLEGFGPT